MLERVAEKKGIREASGGSLMEELSNFSVKNNIFDQLVMIFLQIEYCKYVNWPP